MVRGGVGSQHNDREAAGWPEGLLVLESWRFRALKKPRKPSPIHREGIGIHAVLQVIGEGGGQKFEDRRTQYFGNFKVIDGVQVIRGAPSSTGTPPQLPSTTVRIGQAEQSLRRQGVR